MDNVFCVVLVKNGNSKLVSVKAKNAEEAKNKALIENPGWDIHKSGKDDIKIGNKLSRLYDNIQTYKDEIDEEAKRLYDSLNNDDEVDYKTYYYGYIIKGTLEIIEIILNEINIKVNENDLIKENGCINEFDTDKAEEVYLEIKSFIQALFNKQLVYYTVEYYNENKYSNVLINFGKLKAILIIMDSIKGGIDKQYVSELETENKNEEN